MSGSYCRSLYSFTGEQHQQGLSFDAGEIIRVVQALPGGWWEGERDGHRGWFPSSYVQVLEVSTKKVWLTLELFRDPARMCHGASVCGGLGQHWHRWCASHMNLSLNTSSFRKHSSRILWFAWLHRTGCSPRLPPPRQSPSFWLFSDCITITCCCKPNQNHFTTHAFNEPSQSASTGLTQVFWSVFPLSLTNNVHSGHFLKYVLFLYIYFKEKSLPYWSLFVLLWNRVTCPYV